MASKIDKELTDAAFARRRPAAQIEADVASTIVGRAAQELEAPVLLPVAQIARSPFQPVGPLDEEHLELLAEAIRQDGLLQPVIVRPAAPSKSGNPDNCHSVTPPYELVAGHHRVEVFRRLGRSEIPAVVRHLGDVEAARALASENTNHRAATDWQLFQYMNMLRSLNAVRSNVDLARLLAIPRTKVQYLDAFGLLPLDAQCLVAKHPAIMGYHLAQDLRPYCGAHPELVNEAVRLLAEGKLKQAGVPGWIERQVAPRRPAYRKEVTLEGGVRLVLTHDEARVSGAIDVERLQALIEANLADLTRRG